MSNLGSLVDIVKGWPNGSALAASFKQKAAVGNITEGKIVKLENEASVPVYNLASSNAMQAATGPASNETPLWLVIQGYDQWDANMATKGTCIKLHSGIIFKVPMTTEVNVGDLVVSNAGVLVRQVHATAQIGATGVYITTDLHPVGQVLEYNSYEDWMIVSS